MSPAPSHPRESRVWEFKFKECQTGRDPRASPGTSNSSYRVDLELHTAQLVSALLGLGQVSKAE